MQIWLKTSDGAIFKVISKSVQDVLIKSDVGIVEFRKRHFLFSCVKRTDIGFVEEFIETGKTILIEEDVQEILGKVLTRDDM